MIENHFMYVASGSAEDNQGIGIYSWRPSDGSLQYLNTDTTSASSSYLDVDETGRFLYSVSSESINSFSIDVKTGLLKFLNNLPNSGRGPCHISVSSDQKNILVGYYSSGSLASFSLNNNGSLNDQVDYKEHIGSSIDSSRQEAAHVHQVLSIAESSLILVPDLGIDKVMVYDKNEAGLLTLSDSSFIADIQPGGGPRHAVFHPKKDYAYVLHELTGQVTGFHFDKERGFLGSINTLSTLPENFEGFNKSADIHITPDGQYLYASNRGPNSIAIFRIDSEGVLTFLGTQSCGGDWPRAFAIDPSGKFILVANKYSNQISILKIDYSTGSFEKVSEVETPFAPQGIRFITAD